MASARLTLFGDEVAQLKTSYGKLHEEMNKKLTECSLCIESIDKLYREAVQMTNTLEDKLTNASNEEKEWKDIKVKLATTSLKGMVILNVGGDRFTTSVETLVREKNTFFTALFSKQWQLERDSKDESIFIDRDGKVFAYILAYLRTDVVPIDVMKNESLRHSLIIEAKYYCLSNLENILTEPDRKAEPKVIAESCFPNGTLLEREQKAKLNEFYGKIDQKWELIYKASRDGFDANAFHSRCDNKGPTMTIVRSNNGYLCGGYASAVWPAAHGCYQTDAQAFLFTLVNPHNIPPTQYKINTSKTANALLCNSAFGPLFGANDIHLQANSNSNNTSYIHFPTTYVDTTGKGNITFTGAVNVTTTDIEVFKLA